MTIDSVLREIEKEASKGGRFLPIVGPEKGKFDFLIARAIGAKSVLDLGTLVGYSALLFSRAVGKDGRVTTVELDPDFAEEAKRNFKKAGSKNVTLVLGDAERVIKTIPSGQFDLVLLDISKDAYVRIFDDCLRVVRKGGVILTDNALWNTEELKEFRKKLGRTDAAETVLVPMGDGIAMSVKL